MKYVNFGNNVSGYGFGNQLRAFPLSYLISKLTNRNLITSNYWINNVFDVKNNDVNINNKSTIGIFSNYDKVDYKNIDKDIIEIGGGTFPNMKSHKLYSEEIKNIIGSSSTKFFQEVFDSTFIKVDDKFKELSKKIIDYDNNDYISIQFRSFFDVGNKTMSVIGDFIKSCISLIKEKKLEKLPIFITSDNKEAIKIIKRELKREFNSKFIDTIYQFGHSNKKKDISVLCDWLINSKSIFMMNTGTTYSLYGSWIFKTPCFIFRDDKGIYPWEKKSSKGKLKDINDFF